MVRSMHVMINVTINCEFFYAEHDSDASQFIQPHLLKTKSIVARWELACSYPLTSLIRHTPGDFPEVMLVT